ncbi:hypothetical protein I6G76_06215 [Bacillus cereus]|uniref:hypothetical protein n=1 Tax=Bacillus cereus TaxID=1396 RepID=UPI0002EB9F93|nr:hypothetical protein [Bacillus cereus]AJI26698.1 hypothetical protein BF28_1914 [Bacillus cereus E33L]MCU5553211.1 hypothetical protein [Bacillus cereus]QQA22586.1 hypothetical protein I6G76_06215 [Bacillus cereus]HDR4900294.1 hypothetical protein [Bacillus cereus]
MFKIIIALIATITVLTACNRDEMAKDNRDAIVKHEESSQPEKKEVEQQKNDKPKEQVQNNSQESVNHEKWTSLPEYNKIFEQLGNEDYTFQMVTDNRGERILHILDKGGRKQYKSIFIKNTNRLKIIKINGGGMIFNEILS